MILTPADTDPCIPANNLSTACKHYRTYTNLCSTIKSTLETCCNLSTATDLQCPACRGGTATKSGDRLCATTAVTCGTLDNLSSNLTHPF